MSEIEEGKLEEWDIEFCINLQFNVINCAEFIFENENTELHFKYLGVYLREVGCFYELFFKYILSLISKSLIWASPEKYNAEKHNNADMKTISYEDLLGHAICFGWINKTEYEAIKEIKNLRNKLVHFSCGEMPMSSDDKIIVTALNLNFHISLIKSLLLKHKNSFDPLLFSNLEKNYLN